MTPAKLHWLSCHRQALADNFPHFAAGIRAAWQLIFNEPFPNHEHHN